METVKKEAPKRTTKPKQPDVAEKIKKEEPVLNYATTRVYIRKEPNLKAETVRVLANNEAILVKGVVDGENGKWAIVNEGFVKDEYLKKAD